MVFPNKLSKNVFIIAVALILLGLGNMIYGSLKANEHTALLFKLEEQVASNNLSSSEIPLIEPNLSYDQRTRQIDIINSRIEFYNFITLGGKSLLAVAGMFLLGLLVILRQRVA